MANCYTRGLTTGGVAESADAPDLKSGGRKVVWVRVPPPLLDQGSFRGTFFDRRSPISCATRSERVRSGPKSSGLGRGPDCLGRELRG